jgi:hypothetical protein
MWSRPWSDCAVLLLALADTGSSAPVHWVLDSERWRAPAIMPRVTLLCERRVIKAADAGTAPRRTLTSHPALAGLSDFAVGAH